MTETEPAWAAEARAAGWTPPRETASSELTARYKTTFALQQQARDIGGRHIITGGGYGTAGHYGAVAATADGRPDSWRCHHDHPAGRSALECALAEVRRLADGGTYEPCSAGPDCQDEFCRRDWAGLAP